MKNETIQIIFELPKVGLEFACSCTWVLYPLDPESSFLVFTGIPPHVALLKEVQRLQQLILGLLYQFDKRLENLTRDK